MYIKVDNILGSIEGFYRVILSLSGVGINIIRVGRNIETNYRAKLEPYKGFISFREV